MIRYLAGVAAALVLVFCAVEYRDLKRDELNLRVRVAALETDHDKQRTDAGELSEPVKVMPRQQPIKPEPDPIIAGKGPELPADANNWHTILFLADDWEKRPDQVRAKQLFDSDPWFVRLKQQTHPHVIKSGDPECKKFYGVITLTPSLLIERANGEVIYRESGAQLGKRPLSLKCAICREVRRHCPDGRCLPLHPTPGPDEKADEVPTVLKVAPAEVAKDEEKPVHKAGFPFLAVIGSLAAAALVLKVKFNSPG